MRKKGEWRYCSRQKYSLCVYIYIGFTIINFGFISSLSDSGDDMRITSKKLFFVGLSWHGSISNSVEIRNGGGGGHTDIALCNQ